MTTKSVTLTCALLAVLLLVRNPAANGQHSVSSSRESAVGTTVQRGAVVRLKAGTALKFQEQVLRIGQGTEEFVVLDVRNDQQVLFLSTKAKSGAEIAVSAPLPSATLAAHTTQEITALISTSVSMGQYASALALTENWGSASERSGAAAAINRMKSAEANQAASANALKAAQAEVSRLSINKSESATLRTWREDASKKVKAIQQRLTHAIEDRESSRKELLTCLGIETPQPAAIDEPPKLKATSFANDPPIVPDFALMQDSSPSYEETLEFLNTKLKGVQIEVKKVKIWFGTKMWFGTNSKKMIITFKWGDIGIFNPADANPEVRYKIPSNGLMDATVSITATGGKDVFTYFPPPHIKDGIPNRSEQIGHDTKGFNINCPPDDAEKIAKALSHLIQMFGGKKDPF